MHEGYYSTIYGLRGIPAEAEEVMVVRDILLANSRSPVAYMSYLYSWFS